MKDDSSSGEEDSDAKVAFMIRNLRKFMKIKATARPMVMEREGSKRDFAMDVFKPVTS